jgi:hypothetical protein
VMGGWEMRGRTVRSSTVTAGMAVNLRSGRPASTVVERSIFRYGGVGGGRAMDSVDA